MEDHKSRRSRTQSEVVTHCIVYKAVNNVRIEVVMVIITWPRIIFCLLKVMIIEFGVGR